MDYRIRGKVALVTGASDGLGLAAARALAMEGVRLAIAARREEKVAAAAESIGATTGAHVLAIPADVTVKEQAASLVREVGSKLGPVAILVANAGGPKPGRFADFSWTDWVDAFGKVVGPVHHLVSAALRDMREARWGRIVSIQSMSIRQPVDGLLLSNSLRPAAAGLMKGLAAELASDGITVNVIGPGSSRTERILELGRYRHPDASEEELPRVLGSSMPIGRLVEPDEIGAAIAFLCSAQAAAITGTYLPVDGGQIRGQM
jgi:3-oxoacyl-[acyl-carrier protein] reductase